MKSSCRVVVRNVLVCEFWTAAAGGIVTLVLRKERKSSTFILNCRILSSNKAKKNVWSEKLITVTYNNKNNALELKVSTSSEFHFLMIAFLSQFLSHPMYFHEKNSPRRPCFTFFLITVIRFSPTKSLCIMVQHILTFEISKQAKNGVFHQSTASHIFQKHVFLYNRKRQHYVMFKSH